MNCFNENDWTCAKQQSHPHPFLFVLSMDCICLIAVLLMRHASTSAPVCAGVRSLTTPPIVAACAHASWTRAIFACERWTTSRRRWAMWRRCVFGAGGGGNRAVETRWRNRAAKTVMFSASFSAWKVSVLSRAMAVHESGGDIGAWGDTCDVFSCLLIALRIFLWIQTSFRWLNFSHFLIVSICDF